MATTTLRIVWFFAANCVKCCAWPEKGLKQSETSLKHPHLQDLSPGLAFTNIVLVSVFKFP